MSTNRCFSQLKTSSPCIAVCNLNLTEDHLITFTNHSRYNPNSLNRSTAIIGLTQEGDKGMFPNQIHHQEAALLFTFFFKLNPQLSFFISQRGLQLPWNKWCHSASSDRWKGESGFVEVGWAQVMWRSVLKPPTWTMWCPPSKEEVLYLFFTSSKELLSIVPLDEIWTR